MRSTDSARPIIRAALILATTAVGCSTATPTGTPGVDRVGRTSLHYTGPEAEVVLSYRAATQRLGEDWLFLDVAITGARSEAIEVKRGKVSLLIPSGEVVPLASQSEFGEAYAGLTAALARANLAREPLDYWVSRTPKSLSFLVPPGAGIAFESVWVSDREVANGRLCFLVPGGVQEGPYELRIDLTESKVRIPFRLGED